jgi:predicted RNA-binding protein with PUA-like domain
MAKQYWLLKSEPDAFSIDDLMKAKNQISSWDGIRNYQARNYIRDGMQGGDLAFFYHSSCKEPAIMGVVEIINKARPDPSALAQHSPYYDPKSTLENPRWFMVDVKFKLKFSSPITLQSLKNNPKLAAFALLNKGNRLSVMPVTLQQWQAINAMVA